MSFLIPSLSHYHHLFFIMILKQRTLNEEAGLASVATETWGISSSAWGLKVDIDNDINAKIINVIAGLLGSWEEKGGGGDEQNNNNNIESLVRKEKEKLEAIKNENETKTRSSSEIIKKLSLPFAKRCCKLRVGVISATSINQRVFLTVVFLSFAFVISLVSYCGQ